DQVARGIGRFEHVVGDALGCNRNRTRPVLEFDQSAKVRISPLRILDLVEGKSRNFQHIDAGEPRIRLSCQYAPHRECERLAERFMAGLKVNRRQHDRRGGKMAAQRTARTPRRVPNSLQPAPGYREKPITPRSGRPPGEGDLVRILQIKGQLSRCGVTGFGSDLQAAKDNFLQPRWNGAVAAAWRNWISPQPVAPIFSSLRFAERSLTGCQEIKDNTQGEQIAARIAPVTEPLLGRDIRSSADGAIRFLLHQVRQLIMPR